MFYKHLLKRSRRAEADARSFERGAKAHLDKQDEYLPPNVRQAFRDDMRRHKRRIEFLEEDVREVWHAQRALAQLPWWQRIWLFNIAFTPVDQMLCNITTARYWMNLAEETITEN